MENETTTTNLTIEELEQKTAKLEQQNAELTAKISWYEEQFRLAQQKRFGASSEKTDSNQIAMDLFNEAEVLSTPASEEPTVESVTYSRKKSVGSREAKLDHFPVETISYTLPEPEQICTCCGGALHEMSSETRNEISIIPAEVKVTQHVRLVYSCRR
ncbi:IS66 family transposase zinc-finger binding domain-containing protein [Paenibacillus alginolyticus]|uniref:IS66 family transposase zinc-finger binding domain-containing protein n=1 Tax=Paenibacillus alginolyticus TaxID=59839 RepID=UPI0004169F1A|nr:IS66 family transposase zinc-finger binding domain-containing protein [Paenibacillus alginolyticus]